MIYVVGPTAFLKPSVVSYWVCNLNLHTFKVASTTKFHQFQGNRLIMNFVLQTFVPSKSCKRLQEKKCNSSEGKGR